MKLSKNRDRGRPQKILYPYEFWMFRSIFSYVFDNINLTNCTLSLFVFCFSVAFFIAQTSLELLTLLSESWGNKYISCLAKSHLYQLSNNIETRNGFYDSMLSTYFPFIWEHLIPSFCLWSLVQQTSRVTCSLKGPNLSCLNVSSFLLSTTLCNY